MEGEEWEVCNDDGFIYKRRKRNQPENASQPEPAPAESEEEIRRSRLARRKASLLAVRERYRKEIENLEFFAASLMEDGRFGGLGSELEEDSAITGSCQKDEREEASETRNPFRNLIEDLLLQVEAQEEILKKLSNICDIADSVCDMRENEMMESFLDLPVWESPRSLMVSLVD